MKSRMRSLLCKCGCCLLVALLIVTMCTPMFVGAEGEIEGIPNEKFTCYYYDLESGEMVTTPELPAMPQSLYVGQGLATFKDYIIVKGRDIYGNPTYYAHMFCEDVEPTSVDVDYTFSGMSPKMEELKRVITNTEVVKQFFPRLGQTWVEWLGVQSVVPDACGVYFWTRFITAYLADEDKIQLDYSESWWQRAILSDTSKLYSIYAEYCGDGVHPWVDITLHYSSKIQSYIAYYSASSNSWNWINSYSPTNAYSYTIAGAECIVSSSFDFVGSNALSGTKGAFVDDVIEQIEDTPIKAPIPSSPSWNEGMTNGGGESADGNLNGAFVSGSWYNDAGTGNPFVAAFVAPWVGINWTYENVATEISLFGVSVADLIATVLVLLVAAVSVTLLLKAVGVVT